MHTSTHAHTDTWTHPSGKCTQAPEHPQVNTHHPHDLPHHWEHARGRGEGRRSAASSWWARSWPAGEQTLSRQPSHWPTAWTLTGNKTRQQVSKHSLINLRTDWRADWRQNKTRQQVSKHSLIKLDDNLNADWKQDKEISLSRSHQWHNQSEDAFEDRKAKIKLVNKGINTTNYESNWTQSSGNKNQSFSSSCYKLCFENIKMFKTKKRKRKWIRTGSEKGKNRACTGTQCLLTLLSMARVNRGTSLSEYGTTRAPTRCEAGICVA